MAWKLAVEGLAPLDALQHGMPVRLGQMVVGHVCAIFTVAGNKTGGAELELDDDAATRAECTYRGVINPGGYIELIVEHAPATPALSEEERAISIALHDTMIEKEDRVISVLNALIATLYPVPLKLLNQRLTVRNGAALVHLEDKIPELVVGVDNEDSPCSSVAAIAATITAIAFDGKRLAWIVDDAGFVRGVTWYESAITDYVPPGGPDGQSAS